MSETLTQLGVGGIIIYLCFREMLGFLAKRKNGHSPVTIVLLERRVEVLEEDTKKLEAARHNVVMPALRWHDTQIEDLGGERSKSLLP